MAEFFDSITPEIRAFVDKQQMFFIATAPHEGRINLSPKGMDTFRVLSDKTIAYLDLTGSGNETAAHLLDDGRATVMFCSFTGAANILRFYGRGRAVSPRDTAYPELAAEFPEVSGVRQIIVIDVEQAQTSCGYGVPEYELVRERPTMRKWLESKGAEGLDAYQHEKNVESIDGLPTGLFEG